MTPKNQLKKVQKIRQIAVIYFEKYNLTGEKIISKSMILKNRWITLINFKKMLSFYGRFCWLTLSMYFHVFSMVFLSMTILWWFCTAGEATTAVNLENIEPTDIFTWFLTISISFMKLNFFYCSMFSVTGQLHSSP